MTIKRIAALFCAGIVCGWMGTAHALTGAQLYNYCKYEACGGYFVGAFDGIRIAQAIAGGTGTKAGATANKSGSLSICPPEDVSDEDVADVAMAYLEQHPNQRYLQAANLSLRAWTEAWPCAKSEF